ncbi:hypothetical protein [Flavilitoribacter nigricans]|uniref:Uncharacterized protein n=1 Tax=Flavilitoribacter nigricans (strain ATCC 23147 / DSM 23189 / NBRC 102662 / NCIMB 1420 / SS-2) TaxID=1122177 RepID=A0A2D0NJ92_FLAN2|nr:hypothetical protein [Flavilitoribacter nigricans]PHN08562.1 hypothetical protein CRP01_01225 [Flavilitoribacter nigricans DSM 23189 = NBRC 102662]
MKTLFLFFVAVCSFDVPIPKSHRPAGFFLTQKKEGQSPLEKTPKTHIHIMKTLFLFFVAVCL